MKMVIKKLLVVARQIKRQIDESIRMLSLAAAINQQKLTSLIERLRLIEPDISNQLSSLKANWNSYWELKSRALHAFQCLLMLRALECFKDHKLVVVDIGDSAGTHMLYLQELIKGRYELETIGVNLDPRAVEKIKARGQNAILCRAEDLDLGDLKVDLFTSFEMVEHLHNPAIFFKRLAVKSAGERLLITVPYLKQSRIGLHNVRNNITKDIHAEEEHIFELSPEDWELLIKHSGWKVVFSKIYYQYPKRWPIISWLLSRLWRKYDFEGFWGAILQKDLTFAQRYKDWEE